MYNLLLDDERSLEQFKIMYNLLLDDERSLEQVHNLYYNYDPNFTLDKWHETKPYLEGEWKIARNISQFIAAIDLFGMPALISFDHDLGERGGLPKLTGENCAKALIKICQKRKLALPEYRIHTQNDVGAKNISSILESYKKSLVLE